MRRHTRAAAREKEEGRRAGGGYVALAGEFAVLSELALRRLDGALTLGHTKEIDILALNQRTNRFFRLEVKATEKGVRGSRAFGRSYAWLMKQKHGKITDRRLVYCFVALNRGGRPQFFLVPSKDVAAYIRWEFKHAKRFKTRHTGKVSSLRVFLLDDNYICAWTTITLEHPNGRGAASYLADTPVGRRDQPGANDGRAGEEAHGRDAQAW